MNLSKQCPEKSKLVDYLLGKLPFVEHETCEVHISDCSACEDTVRSLDVSDTLGDLTRDALTDASESNELNLVNQLVRNVRDIQSTTHSKFDRLTLERSAEVTRFLASANEPGDIGQVAHYRLTDLLGAGSTGVVYRAIDQQLDRAVALKVLRPSLGEAARARFIVEAKSAAAVDHSNVIGIYQVGEENQLAYMAMQLLPGETLETRLKRDAFLAEEKVRSIAAQIADGLSAAHAKDLIHRDIKPANIWLDENDHVKILDFGLARIVNDDPGFTSTGMIAGTPCYMSPEQSKGAVLDGRSDLFSLGCVLYRASTGRQPFGAANILSTLQAIQNNNPLPPQQTSANVSQELSDLTMCMLEKLPVNRPESATQVTRALSSDRANWNFSIPEYESVEAKPLAGSKYAAPNTTGGMSWIGQLATLLMIGMFGLGGYFFGGDIIRIATGQGLLTIETDDPDVKIELLQAGKLVRIIDTKTEKQIDIKEGKYKLQVAGEDNSVEISPVDLTMKRGGKAIAHVTHSPNSPNNELSPGPGIRPANNLDTAWTASDSSAAKSITEEFNQKNIEKLREDLEKKLSSLSESIPADQRQQNAQWMDARLELAEFEVDAGVRKYERQKSKNPRDIAELHAKMQQFYELLKSRLSLDFDDSIEASFQQKTLKTRTELAQKELWNFEAIHGLNTDVVKYNGQTLEQFLTTARTERSETKLFDAYTGVAHLADQFNTRQEFVEFVTVALVTNAPRFLVRRNRTIPSPTENGILALLLELKRNELAKISTACVTSTDASKQGIPMMLLGRSRFENLVTASFHNQDDLHEQLLDANSPAAKKFLARLTNYSLAHGKQIENKSLQNRLVEMFQAEANSAEGASARSNSGFGNKRSEFAQAIKALSRKNQSKLSASGMGAAGLSGADNGGGADEGGIQNAIRRQLLLAQGGDGSSGGPRAGAGGARAGHGGDGDAEEEAQKPKTYFKTYKVEKYTNNIVSILDSLINRDESIKVDQDRKTKNLYISGTERHHKLVAGILRVLSAGDSANLVSVDKDSFIGIYKTKASPNQVTIMLDEIISPVDFQAYPLEESIIFLGNKENHEKFKEFLKSLEETED